MPLFGIFFGFYLILSMLVFDFPDACREKEYME